MEISKKKLEKFLPHFIGLLLFLILPIFVFDRNNERAIYWIYSYYYQLAFMIIAFYFNYLVIIPRFFFSKRKVYFFIVLLLFIFLLLSVWQYLFDYFELLNLGSNNISGESIPPRHRSRLGLHPKLIDNFFLLLIVLGFSSGMAIIQYFRKNESKQKEIEKARVDSELAFLKNQISPHFFFNALNNIYGLIAIDRDKAQQMVEKLSGLMRYLIYDSNIDTIELQKEFDFTLKYIELMQQRLSPKVKLDINISDKIPKGQIPPILFIPFVENAFKHGISYREHSFISIKLITEDDKVVFVCKNSIPTNREQNNNEGGVGIANIQKRLDLIYGNSLKLDISKVDKEYLVHLVIPFKNIVNE